MRAFRDLANIRSALFSKENLTGRASLNAAASGAEYTARALMSFIVTPVLVRGLGERDFGLWLVLARLTGYLGAASGRSPQALKWTIAKNQHSNRGEEKQRAVAAAGVAWLVFLPVLVVLGGALVWFTPTWLHAPIELQWVIRATAAILVARLVVTNLVALPRAVLEGENLGYRRMGLSTALVAVGGGLTILAVRLGTGLAGVATATLVTVILGAPLYLLLTRSSVPWFGVARPERKEVRTFLGLSIWFLLWRLISTLMLSSDIVILGIVKSPEVVSTYALTKYVPEVLVSLVGVFVFSSSPGLGGILGAGDLARVSRLRAELMVLTWFLTTTFGATLLLWNEAFLALWVGSGHYAGSTATLLIVIMTSQYVLLRNDANFLDLALDVSRKVQLGAISLAVSIAAAVLAVKMFDLGIAGLCGGLILGRLILNIAYPRLVGRLLQLPPGSQARAVLRPASTAAALFAISFLLGRRLAATAVSLNWPELILLGLATAAAFAFVAFFAGISATQRAMTLKRPLTLFEKIANR